MAKKQVTVNEELLRGIMAGDVPVYGGGHDMKSAVRQKKRKDESGSYRRQFLKGGNIQLRQQAYISLENYQFIRRFLSVVAPGVSMSKYIDDILTAHLEQYREEINSLYNNQINNQPLYKE